MKKTISLLLCLCLLLSLCACAAPETAEGGETSVASDNVPAGNGGVVTEGDVKSCLVEVAPAENGGAAKKAYRMFPYFWLSDEAFAATEAGLLKYADAVDEITLFCDNMNASYMDEANLQHYATTVAKRIAALKADGFESVGVNMLQTVGHGRAAVEDVPVPPMQTAVNYDGAVAPTQLCFRSDEFKAYVMHKYEAFAKADPDFIWVDDDFRISDKYCAYACFCDDCMAKFNAQQGTDFTREDLVMRLEGNANSPDAQAMRLAWSNYTLNGYVDVMTWIRQAVESVDPDIELGLMTVHLPANQYILSDFEPMLDALGADKARPGGGFHEEATTQVMFQKIMGVAQQNTQLADIADVQYEFEDFPQTFNKSTRMHITETTAAIMAGCSGIAFASMPPDYGNDENMEAITAASSMWDEMVALGRDWKLYGGTAAWDNEYGIYAFKQRYFKTDAHGFYNQELLPFVYGFMPYTPYQENSAVTVITEDMAKAMTEDELRDVFSKGVYMDGGAANILANLGYGEWVGCSNCAYKTQFTVERYSDHELNGEAKGVARYMYGTGYWTYRLADGAEALAYAEDNEFHTSRDITAYVYENSLGGRVAVFGYVPWTYQGTWQRTEQIENVIEWLCNDQMAVKVLNDTRVFNMFKKSDDGSQFMLMLVPGTLDDTPDDMQVRLAGEFGGTFYVYDETGTKYALSEDCISVSGGFTTLTLPSIGDYSFFVIFNQP